MYIPQSSKRNWRKVTSPSGHTLKISDDEKAERIDIPRNKYVHKWLIMFPIGQLVITKNIQLSHICVKWVEIKQIWCVINS